MAVHLGCLVDLGRSEWKTTDGNFRTKVSYHRLDNLLGCRKGIEQEGGVVFRLILPTWNELQVMEMKIAEIPYQTGLDSAG